MSLNFKTPALAFSWQSKCCSMLQTPDYNFLLIFKSGSFAWWRDMLAASVLQRVSALADLQSCVERKIWLRKHSWYLLMFHWKMNCWKIHPFLPFMQLVEVGNVGAIRACSWSSPSASRDTFPATISCLARICFTWSHGNPEKVGSPSLQSPYKYPSSVFMTWFESNSIPGIKFAYHHVPSQRSPKYTVHPSL